jgi:hypothetical protein
LKRQRPSKLENVLELAKSCIDKGNYLPTFHAECRQFERDITLLDALYVIKNGYREPKHDQFKEEWQTWNYAIQGETLQNDTVRVIISFDESTKLLIITVINIVKRE